MGREVTRESLDYQDVAFGQRLEAGCKRRKAGEALTISTEPWECEVMTENGFIMRVDQKLSAFLELESATWGGGELS